MAEGLHDSTRRAVLGAAVGVPLSSSLRRRPESTLSADQPAHDASDEAEWDSALAAFRSAQAAVEAVEAVTAGASLEVEEAWLPAHGAACSGMEGALARVMALPAPGRAALGVKIFLLLAYEVEPGAVSSASAAALLADARRLLAA